MKVQFFRLALGLAVAVLAGSPATADGWSQEGIRNYNRSISVPAPRPIPVNAAQWYLRADVAWVAGAEGEFDVVSGAALDVDGFATHRPFVYGFGFGRYLDNSNFRWDATFDFRYDHTIAKGSDGLSVEMAERTALLNAYYDFENHTSFTPYLGLGLGLSWYELSFNGPSYSGREYDYGLAIAAYAGVSYALSDGIHIDTTYKYQYSGGNLRETPISGGGRSEVDMGDRSDHQLRTGVRFDIF